MKDETLEKLIGVTSDDSTYTDSVTHGIANGINGDLRTDIKRQSSEKGTVLYGRRWYILAIFSYLAFQGNLIWNTWGPISKSAEAAFGWTDGEIALLADWGPITYMISALFLAWLMDVKGLRVAVIVMAALFSVGASLRCITTTLPTATWLIHAGQIVTNLGGPVAMGGPPLLSATWFPAHQRATATGMCVALSNMGIATSFLLGPYLVSENRETNGTVHNISTGAGMTGFTQALSGSSHNSTISNNTSDILQIRSEIRLYMYIVAGMTAAGFLAVLVYFPAAPPTPPSHSATIKRMPYKEGLKRIFRPGVFWILCIPYVVGCGFYNMWGSVIDVIVSPLGVSEKTAGWVGFYGTIASQISQILVGRFSDVFSRKMKLFLIVLYTLSLFGFVGFALMCSRVIPYQLWIFYLTYILIGVSLNGAVPLYYELVCEVLYPVSEGIANTVLTALNNFAGLGFTLILLIPNIGSAWMNWTLAAVMLLCIPILCLFKEHYGRLDIDLVDVDASDHSINVAEQNSVNVTAPDVQTIQNITT